MNHVRHSPLSQLSKGMTQRIALACALVADPQVLILDEPSSGLDPVGRKELRELLERFRSEGKTLFLSSHLLSEMESVCDRVGILAEGKMVACGAPNEIVEARDQVAIEFEVSQRDEVIETQVELMGGKLSDPDSSLARAPRTAIMPAGSVYNIIQLLHERCAKLCSVVPQRETLEDAFLRLVNGGVQ
jgi:ABC-2 type transport system ATP-binding protein